MSPLMNDDIMEFKRLLTEIRDALKRLTRVEVVEVPIKLPVKKKGRPKGSKNVKRTGKG